MIEPRIPDDEADRLAALRRYEILDTLPEQAYDDITLLAAEICGTPIAAISLVDGGRQWFKSKLGLAVEQTDRNIAFCAHAILDPKQPLIVGDASRDDRFAHNPLVTGAPSIRFYAGAPLVTPDGFAVGTLCVIDQVPRTLTPRQVQALLVLSREVITQLELRSNLKRLEQTVRDLERAEAELQRSRAQELALKDRFISHVSHELRSPLTAIYGFVTLLLDGLVGPLNEEQRGSLGIVLRNTLQLKEMIQDLLELTRSKAGKLRVEPRALRVEEPIEDILRAARLTAEGKGIQVEAEVAAELPPLVADPVRLRQILSNLVENAINHTPAGGRISIRAEIDPSDAGLARLSVTDSGCGIAAEHCERVFEHLFQVEHGFDAGRKGLGLGLAICKEVVRRHGGRIWVESEVGRGSSFFFTLPLLDLEREIASRLRDGGDADAHAVLISVVARPDGGRIEDSHDSALNAVWESLAACLDPTRDVVLPRLGRAEDSERFAAVALTDERGAEVIKQRLERLLPKSSASEGSGLCVRVQVWLLDVAHAAPGKRGAARARELAERVEELLAEVSK